jgi:O-antigen/teichoic acid export membrane protein
LSKAVSIVVNLAMVPLMLSSLGDYSYGLWLTLQSLLGLGTFADLGIGNGAMNALSAAQARGDRNRINRIITSAVTMLAGLSVFGVVMAPVASRWAVVQQVGGSNASDVAAGLAAFTAYFALSLPLGFIDRVNAAFQEAAVTNLARSGVAVATLACTWIAARSGGSFKAICIATLAPQLLGWALVWIIEFRRRPWLMLGYKLFDRSLARSVLGVGLLFLGIQLLSAFNWSMDNILISSVLGPEHVTPYAVQVRVFALVGSISSMILTPLWPAYADAVVHGDHAWIRKTLLRSLVGAAAVSAPLAFGAAAALPLILRVWTGDGIRTSPLLAYGLASLTVCQTICAALAMFWNGTSAIRVQFIIGLVLVAVSLPLKIFLLTHKGIAWFGLVSSVLIIIVVFLPAFFLVRSCAELRRPDGPAATPASGS